MKLSPLKLSTGAPADGGVGGGVIAPGVLPASTGPGHAPSIRHTIAAQH